MKTLKIGLTLFTMLIMVTFGSAQTSTRVDASKEKAAANKERTEKIIKYLELSEEQAAKARTTGEKYFSLMSNASDATEKKKLNDEADAEVKKILTEEQYKKYRSYLTAEKNPQQSKPVGRVSDRSSTSN